MVDSGWNFVTMKQKSTMSILGMVPYPLYFIFDSKMPYGAQMGSQGVSRMAEGLWIRRLPSGRNGRAYWTWLGFSEFLNFKSDFSEYLRGFRLFPQWVWPCRRFFTQVFRKWGLTFDPILEPFWGPLFDPLSRYENGDKSQLQKRVSKKRTLLGGRKVRFC